MKIDPGREIEVFSSAVLEKGETYFICEGEVDVSTVLPKVRLSIQKS
jgi:hypothetical protein